MNSFTKMKVGFWSAMTGAFIGAAGGCFQTHQYGPAVIAALGAALTGYFLSRECR